MMNRYSFYLVSSLCAAQINLDHAAREIVHNELKFSHTSAVKGRNAAFLEFFSDSCIVLNPVPVNGKELYKKLPERNAYLTWEPAYVEVSSSGNFGFSTGPWKIRNESLGNEPAAIGYYVSMWERQSDRWKVIFDIGIGYDTSIHRKEELRMVFPAASTKGSVQKERTSFVETEQLLISSASAQTYADVHNTFASQNIRVYRNGIFPTVGVRESKNIIAQDRKHYYFQLLGSKTSQANDLGYTYGIAVSHDKDTSTYLRIWRREEEWKIALELLSSIH